MADRCYYLISSLKNSLAPRFWEKIRLFVWLNSLQPSPFYRKVQDLQRWGWMDRKWTLNEFYFPLRFIRFFAFDFNRNFNWRVRVINLNLMFAVWILRISYFFVLAIFSSFPNFSTVNSLIYDNYNDFRRL